VNDLAHTVIPHLRAPDHLHQSQARLAQHVATLVGTEASLVTAIPGVTLYRYTAPTAPVSSTYEPSLALVVQGRKRVSLGSLDFEYSPERFLLTSVDLPVTSQVIEASCHAPYLCVRFKLDMLMVRELLGRAADLPVWSKSDQPGMSTARTTAEILDAFHRLMALQHAPRDIAFMSELIGREIVYRVLQSDAGQRLRAIATVGDNSQHTARAVAWIRENYTKPLRMDALARVACMGISTLHHHFRALTSMTPLQYQKRLRLHEARRRMLIDGLDAAHAAFEVGYESASQFNREYSRLFGQPPIRDVRRLRTAGGGASG
jgi:AraC-like DNA-binding protein